nr:MAG TPA: hypothetical protein [Bacteriophage sp.]
MSIVNNVIVLIYRFLKSRIYFLMQSKPVTPLYINKSGRGGIRTLVLHN